MCSINSIFGFALIKNAFFFNQSIFKKCFLTPVTLNLISGTLNFVNLMHCLAVNVLTTLTFEVAKS